MNDLDSNMVLVCGHRCELSEDSTYDNLKCELPAVYTRNYIESYLYRGYS